jgi:hypothetical protein
MSREPMTRQIHSTHLDSSPTPESAYPLFLVEIHHATQNGSPRHFVRSPSTAYLCMESRTVPRTDLRGHV